MTVLTGGVWVILMAAGFMRVPDEPAARSVAWALGFEEEVYNFGAVIPGRVYRSARPDARFIEHLYHHYGVRRIVCMTDENDYLPVARKLGMEIVLLDWSSNRVPPDDELASVLELMEDGSPLLLHCSAGKDRTGYAVGAWRLEREGWSLERVLEEMEQFRYDVEDKPWFQERLTALAKERAPTPSSAP